MPAVSCQSCTRPFGATPPHASNLLNSTCLNPPSLALQGTEAAAFTLDVAGRFGILPNAPVYPELQSFAAFAKQTQVRARAGARCSLRLRWVHAREPHLLVVLHPASPACPPAYATTQDTAIFTCPADKPRLAPVFLPAPNCPPGCAPCWMVVRRGQGCCAAQGSTVWKLGLTAPGIVSHAWLVASKLTARLPSCIGWTAATRAPPAPLTSTSACAARTTAHVSQQPLRCGRESRTACVQCGSELPLWN